MKPAVHRLPGTVSHRVKQPTALQVHQAGHLPRGRLRGRGEKPGSSSPSAATLQAGRVVHQRPAVVAHAPHAGRPADAEVAGDRRHGWASLPTRRAASPEPARSAPPEDEPRPPARSRFPYRRQARCDRYRPDTHRQHHRGRERRRCPPPEASILLGASLGASGRTAAVAHGLPCPFRSRLLPVCCPTRASGTARAWRKRPARPVTRAVVGWR
jgi:hypothetical protein